MLKCSRAPQPSSLSLMHLSWLPPRHNLEIMLGCCCFLGKSAILSISWPLLTFFCFDSPALVFGKFSSSISSLGLPSFLTLTSDSEFFSSATRSFTWWEKKELVLIQILSKINRMISLWSRLMIIFQPLIGKHKHQEQRWSQCHLYERQRGLRSCSSQNTCHRKCGSIKHPLFTVNQHSPPCCICGGSIGGATPANEIIHLVEQGERVEYNP